VSTIAWIGYQTPSVLTVAFAHRAKVGGRRLAAFVNGLDASRQMHRVYDETMPALHLTLIGHSYGSVAVGFAMRSRPPVDDVVLLGSPGAAAPSARELTGTAAHVYVGEARGDAVADLSWFGPDPSGQRFGARALQTDGEVDGSTGSRLTASHGHSRYFRERSESLRNIAAVTIAMPQLASYGDMSATGDHVLDGWRLVAG
jgi:hypothetical protein